MDILEFEEIIQKIEDNTINLTDVTLEQLEFVLKTVSELVQCRVLH